jgi:hypothetical protein
MPTKYDLKSTIFWDIMLCSPLKVIQWFGGTYRLHLQGQQGEQDTIVKAGGKCYVPEDNTLHNHFCKNLRSYKICFVKMLCGLAEAHHHFGGTYCFHPQGK